MRDERVEYRGFHFGHMLLALLGGAAAGAAAAYLTAPRAGAVTRKRLLCMADDAGDSVTRVPEAIQKATEAARNAFMEALKESERR